MYIIIIVLLVGSAHFSFHCCFVIQSLNTEFFPFSSSRHQGWWNAYKISSRANNQNRGQWSNAETLLATNEDKNPFCFFFFANSVLLSHIPNYNIERKKNYTTDERANVSNKRKLEMCSLYYVLVAQTERHSLAFKFQIMFVSNFFLLLLLFQENHYFLCFVWGSGDCLCSPLCVR